MTLLQKLKQPELYSTVEQILVDFILANPNIVLTSTAKQLSKITYTSASSVVRLCQKLECNGYNDFKVKLAAEINTDVQTNSIDANFPFQVGDSMKDIARKISNLNIESIHETITLFDVESYEKAVDLLYHAKIIDIYGASMNLQLALDFKYKLLRIDRLVAIHNFSQEQLLSAAHSSPDHCALIISYAGESREALRIAKLLKHTKTPLIVITSLGNNSLSKYSDILLNIVTKEQMYSKIGQFSSRTSMMMILDFLYAGIFEKNYEQNLAYINQSTFDIFHLL